MQNQHLSRFLLLVCFVPCALIASLTVGTAAIAQTFPPNPGGDPVQQQIPIDPQTDPNIVNQDASEGEQTGTIGDRGDGTVDPNNVDIEISDDVRNQGFVGATTVDVVENGYIGAASETSGPPLAPNATFGGGVNGSVSRSVGGRAGGVQNQGFGGAGQQNGFSVTRKSLRTRLRPSFSTPQVSSNEVSSRFNNRLYRLPQSQNLGGQFQVSVANRKATITGMVPSQADADRVVRQLRLEPGVYSIDNQLQIGSRQ